MPKKLHCQSQPRLTKFLHSLSPVFDIAIITRLENVSDFGSKMQVKPRSSKDQTFSHGSLLKTKGFPPKAMFKFTTNISRILRIVCNTDVAVTRACLRASAEENPMLHVEWLITNRKAMTRFMNISNNNTEYSRYENFDLTRMFNKQCFCDSKKTSSHGWLQLTHFPREYKSKMQAFFLH